MVVSVSCSTLEISGSNFTSDGDNNNIPSHSSEMGIDEEDVFVEENLKWSVLYNPVNTSIMDVKALQNQNRLEIPLLSANYPNNYRVLYPKSYYVDEDSVYLPSDLKKVISINRYSGKKIWTTELAANVIGVGDSTVITYRDDNRLYGLNKTTGEEKWKVILNSLVSENDKIVPFPYVIQTETDLVIPVKHTCSGNYTMTFLHIDERSGATRLTECLQSIEKTIPILFLDEMVIAVSDSSMHQHYFGLNVNDGSINWEFSFDSNILNLLKFDDGVLYINIKNYVNEFGDIIALDAKSGKMVWGKPLAQLNNLESDEYGYKYSLSGNFEIKNNYIISENVERKQVLVFRKSDGVLLNVINASRTFKAYFLEDGLILHYTDLGLLSGMDYLTGKELWTEDEIQLTKWPFYSRSFDNVILLVSEDNKIIAVNQKNGKLLWDISLDSNKPMAYYEGKIVFIEDQRLKFLDPETGIIREINIGDAEQLVGNGGHIEIIDNSSWLLCGTKVSLVKIN